MASTQQSLVVQETGKPVVKVTRPIPTPKENEVLIKTTSVGINPHDAKSRDINLFQLPIPTTLCNDVAGVITAKGDKVSGFELNDHVFGYPKFGVDSQASQQYAVLEVGSFAKVPSNITDDEAATIPVNLFASALSFWSDKSFGFPAPWADNKTFNASSQAIVILGGGTSCGKFAVQVAKITGFGKIVVVASKSNTDELKSYGATHVIDRHDTDSEVKARVQEAVGDEIIYVYDPINREHSFAISLLSEKKRGKIITLLRVQPSSGNYDIAQTLGLPQMHMEFSKEFFKLLPSWIISGEIKTLGFKVFEGGLDVDAFNKILDDHLAGRNPGKWHFHPNA
ncbi:putative alcohol zinc- protein [Botrytis cinerea BcDW1]|uniref:Similar to alcohol dehydrogenase n=2 Tax=Botryotinia fuckeliana TaxID=40559 RepID=G2YRQ9_BOTF4|nr:putative alcohol zinc- protein [Botrytis cinerea BcDW1]CCD54307.1 similar to alcohol dehydrogenase [Botrytis cinerea T4]